MRELRFELRFLAWKAIVLPLITTLAKTAQAGVEPTSYISNNGFQDRRASQCPITPKNSLDVPLERGSTTA